MAYRIFNDGLFSTILRTKDTPDEVEVFETLTEARQELVEHLTLEIKDLQQARTRVRALRVKTVEDDLDPYWDDDLS